MYNQNPTELNMSAFNRHINYLRQEPEAEPPSKEDWMDWDKLCEEAIPLYAAENEALQNHKKLIENNASKEKVEAGKKAEWAARGASMCNYNAKVKWGVKFGFRNFNQLYEARDLLD
jgi:hypothetical protein